MHYILHPQSDYIKWGALNIEAPCTFLQEKVAQIVYFLLLKKRMWFFSYGNFDIPSCLLCLQVPTYSTSQCTKEQDGCGSLVIGSLGKGGGQGRYNFLHVAPMTYEVHFKLKVSMQKYIQMVFLLLPRLCFHQQTKNSTFIRRE